MQRLRGPLRAVTLGAAVLVGSAWAQSADLTVVPPPPPANQAAAPSPAPAPAEDTTAAAPPAPQAQGAPAPAPPAVPPTDVQPPAPTPTGTVEAVPAPANANVENVPPPPDSGSQGLLPPGPKHLGPVLDGHLRSGPFLSGPGSLTFILHHTLLGAAGGLVTQGVANDWRLDAGGRENLLVGTLVGAGAGFGLSSWWQFNHWTGLTTANFGVVNSFISGMFFTGMANLFTTDATTLTWTAFLGTELGAWMTAGLGGGDLPLNDGLLIASGGMWGLFYGGLLLATISFSGARVTSPHAVLDPMLMAPGIGASLAALATLRFHPSTPQILRADAFGLGVGALVLLSSALAIGKFQSPTPYVLSLITSAAAVTTVSIFWEESAERPRAEDDRLAPYLDRPYTCAWW